MPEGMNVEIAHKLTESEPEAGHKPSRAEERVEIAEAVVLALVAVATAWSGYQSAKWDGHQALLYGTSARLRVEAAETREEARQLQVYDALTLNAWIEAKQRHDPNLVAIYQRRFSPEFRVAFEAWLKMDPLNNPKAPIGPAFIPEYRNARLVQAQRARRAGHRCIHGRDRSSRDGRKVRPHNGSARHDPLFDRPGSAIQDTQSAGGTLPCRGCPHALRTRHGGGVPSAVK